MLVYLRVDEILDSSGLLWTLVAPSAQRSRGGIWQQLSFSGPLFVSAQRVLLVSNAQAVLRSMAGRVVIRPDGYTGLIAGAAGGLTGSFAQPTDDSLPGFPLGAKARRSIIHTEGEVP